MVALLSTLAQTTLTTTAPSLPKTALTLIIVMIVVALVFDFLNGFHDAANSIATIVSTRVLSPFQAVLWAAFFNFIAFLVFGLSVAKTVGTGVIEPGLVDTRVIFGALMGATTLV